MSTLSLDIRIEQHAFEVSDSRGIVIRGWLSKLFSPLGKISISNWLSGKLVNSIKELIELLEEEMVTIPEMEKEEAEKLYQSSKKSIKSLIKFNDSLIETDYLDNLELKQTFTKCLSVFYILEAKSKKVAKSGNYSSIDKDIKIALSEKSIESIGSNLSK